MNKTEVVESVADKTGLSKKDCEKAVNAFMETVVLALQRSDKVQMLGFGSFEVKDKPERTGHNPRTGEAILIPASKVPAFKPGKAFKDSLNR